MDIHLVNGFSELPLAPKFPAHTVDIIFGSRPGGALLGRPGALVGAFAVSGVMHDLGMWGLGQRTAGFPFSWALVLRWGIGSER